MAQSHATTTNHRTRHMVTVTVTVFALQFHQTYDLDLCFYTCSNKIIRTYDIRGVLDRVIQDPGDHDLMTFEKRSFPVTQR
jgi:hypothetical protein